MKGLDVWFFRRHSLETAGAAPSPRSHHLNLLPSTTTATATTTVFAIPVPPDQRPLLLCPSDPSGPRPPSTPGSRPASLGGAARGGDAMLFPPAVPAATTAAAPCPPPCCCASTCPCIFPCPCPSPFPFPAGPAIRPVGDVVPVDSHRGGVGRDEQGPHRWQGRPPSGPWQRRVGVVTLVQEREREKSERGGVRERSEGVKGAADVKEVGRHVAFFKSLRGKHDTKRDGTFGNAREHTERHHDIQYATRGERNSQGSSTKCARGLSCEISPLV